MPPADPPDLDRLKELTTISFHRVGATIPLPDLIAGAREARPQFIGELYRRYHHSVTQFLFGLSPDGAEDLAQEVFLQLPVALARYEDRGQFDAWLKRVAFNVYRTRRRAADRRREADLDDHVAPPPADAMGAVTREDLWSHAMAGMPERLREVWVLHREGYEAKDIAELIGISAGAAATRLTRAREYLAGTLPGLT